MNEATEPEDAIDFLAETNLSGDQRHCVDALILAFREMREKCRVNMLTALSLRRQLHGTRNQPTETTKTKGTI